MKVSKKTPQSSSKFFLGTKKNFSSIFENSRGMHPFFAAGSKNVKKSFSHQITSKISIFKPCHTFIKVSGHQYEQLLYFTVFCGTNGIKVMAILRSCACHWTTKFALFGPITFKILIFEKNAKP